MEEKTCRIIEDIGIGKVFMTKTLIAQEILQSQPTTVTISSSDGRLIFRIYKEHQRIKLTKIKDPIKKWASEMNSHFLDKVVQIKK